jgi:hypothetical protein
MNVIGSRLFGCERLESPGYETRRSCSTGPDIVSNNFSNGKTPDASQFLNRAGKISLAPGFSPVMITEDRRGAVSTAFARKGNPLKRVLSP